MRILIFENYIKMSKWAAYYIASKINQSKLIRDKPFVLGLPAGTSPIRTYQELSILFREGKVSFKNVITFNMDEFVGIPEHDPNSFRYHMHQHLFNHVDIPEENINFPNNNSIKIEEKCKEYEKKIQDCGGIDLFLCGVGVDGHIAFNAPGSSFSSRTRIISLTHDVRITNSGFFNNDINKVPKEAITVGVGTIMDSKEILIVISGHSKARALRMAIEEGVNHMWIISLLQLHPNTIIACDEEATQELKVCTVKYFKDTEHDVITKLPKLI